MRATNRVTKLFLGTCLIVIAIATSAILFRTIAPNHMTSGARDQANALVAKAEADAEETRIIKTTAINLEVANLQQQAESLRQQNEILSKMGNELKHANQLLINTAEESNVPLKTYVELRNLLAEKIRFINDKIDSTNSTNHGSVNRQYTREIVCIFSELLTQIQDVDSKLGKKARIEMLYNLPSIKSMDINILHGQDDPQFRFHTNKLSELLAVTVNESVPVERIIKVFNYSYGTLFNPAFEESSSRDDIRSIIRKGDDQINDFVSYNK